MSSSMLESMMYSLGGAGGGVLTTAALRPERRTSCSGGSGTVGLIVKLTARSSVALITKLLPSGGVHSSNVRPLVSCC